jgi:L-amino acid N-acyltransferase YncA
MTEVRIANSNDARELLEIYKPFILTTAFTFETEVPYLSEFSSRIIKYLEKYPWIVCVVNGQIAGYAYASGHRDRDAYQWTCECSVYIHDNFKGKGIGRHLYTTLFEILKYQGFRNVYAGITIPNEASEKMHAKCGFELFAVYENIGYKLGAWHKVGWWKLQLNGYDLLPPPPKRFSEIDQGCINRLFK